MSSFIIIATELYLHLEHMFNDVVFSRVQENYIIIGFPPAHNTFLVCPFHV